MKQFELKPQYDGRKSFYGKARVTQHSGNLSVLTSYETEVAAVKNGRPIRLWDGWSATTARHVNEFFRQYGFKALSKKEWLAMPVENLTVDIIVTAVENLRSIA